MDLVADYIRRLRDLGYTITHDWVSVIRAVGDANPRQATLRQRTKWSAEDMRGIEAAHMVWALLPVKPSFGCAFEIGYAIGHGVDIIVSGDWRASIFTAHANAVFNEHDHAFEWLKLYGTPGNWEDEMLELEAE